MSLFELVLLSIALLSPEHCSVFWFVDENVTSKTPFLAIVCGDYAML